RHSALSRSYRYRLFTRSTPSPFELRRSWWPPKPLDEDALTVAAAALAGEHDFRAFTPAQTQHQVFVRVVERAEWIRRGDHLDFEITADSYLRHMVRSLVGTMVDAPGTIPELLGGRARSEAGPARRSRRGPCATRRRAGGRDRGRLHTALADHHQRQSPRPRALPALGHGDRRVPPSCGHRGAPQPQARNRRARSTRDTDRPRARARASSPASAGSLARSKAEGRDLAWSELEPAVDVLLLVESDPAGRQA